MDKESDKQLITMLQSLVEEKDKMEEHLSFLESVLSRNSIYFLLFTRSGNILYHNIPNSQNLTTLDDCEYILDRNNIDQIRKFMVLSDSPGSETFEVTLKNNLLEFTFYTMEEFPDVYFLQITMYNQQKLNQLLSEENELEKAETGLEDIQMALGLLDEIRNIDSSEKKEKLSSEIQEHYIIGLDSLQATIHDPIVSLCLDIIKKNLEEFMAPTSALSQLYQVLTPSEIKVADFIRMGKTSKDIADALDIAQKTVENHRNKVRDKLGLRNKGINLRSYLMQLES